ncbi:MAG: hypothetical protein CM1200mP41_36500 [Gammaproteobacteria bacterium]|nr:MAG: hypothetical protein CM1200mP41_36500 [Gammaproteobacteria bacterium]
MIDQRLTTSPPSEPLVDHLVSPFGGSGQSTEWEKMQLIVSAQVVDESVGFY